MMDHHHHHKGLLKLPPTHGFGLDELCRCTKFTRKEIQLMYRSFKQECPSGQVDEDTFKMILSRFFPLGSTALYAHYVFKTFDRNKSGTITFKEFLEGLSLLCHGDMSEKLAWAFSLYDINGDGLITKKEMSDIICSIYALLGRRSTQNVDDKHLQEHVDRIFRKLDVNKDGVVTREEFMKICEQDETITKSLSILVVP